MPVDVRIIFTGYVLSILLCTVVMASLWRQNRKRHPEIFLWLAYYVLQLVALFLFMLRGIIPDLFSIVLANSFLIGGSILLYTGAVRYVGKESRQLHNYVMLAVFTLVHFYLTYIYPDMELRAVNLSVALLYISAQGAWLLLRRTDAGLRPATRIAGIVCVVFCLVSVVQILFNLTMPKTISIWETGFFGMVIIIVYQILFIALSLSMFLMVGRRLSDDLEGELLQRRQEEKLIKLRLSLLEFAATHSLNEVLQKTLDEIGTLIDSPIGFYHFVENDQKTLSLQAWSTRTLKEFCKAEGKGLHYGIDQAGVWVDCVYEKRAVIHNDYHSLPHRKGLPEGHAPVIRELVVPIMRGGLVVAILGVGNKPVNYTEKDAQVISYLADVAWEIKKRKQAEEELRKSEERFRQLAEVFPETIFESDIQGNVTYANEHGLNKFGLTQEDIVQGINIFDMVSPQDRDLARERLQGRLEGRQKGYLEYRAQKKDGSFFYAMALSAPIRVDGATVGMRGFILDITERKLAEAARKENEVFLNTLLNSIPLPVFYKNKPGQYTGFNKAYEIFFGAAKEKLIGKTVFDLSPPALAKIYYEKDQELFEGGGDQRYESQVKNSFGETRDVIFNKAVLTDSQGAISGLIGAIYDITERKKAEEALRESEERIHAITNSAKDAIIMMDNNGNISYWNPAAEHMLGYTGAEAMGKNLHELITPKRFIPAHLAAFPEFQKTGRGNAIGKTLELAARRKDGREVDVALSLSAVKIEEVWHAVGIMQDITERKQAEAALRESEERYHFIADHTADHIWTMDLSMRFMYSSPAVIKILGYTAEELMTKTFDRFFTSESLVRAKEWLAEELAIEGNPETDPNRISTFQSEHHHKNGTLVWLESSLTFIRDTSMKPIGILGVSRDITERKKTEEQIQYMATHDLLTDLPSLRLARDRLSFALNMARRYKKAVAVMFIDLDGFKAVNDTLGHDAGDYVLRKVAQRMLSCVRETDTVARVGGDEFLIIATEINTPGNAAQIAEKVIQLVSKPIIFEGQQTSVGASIGIALFPDQGEDMDQLIKLADEAMYSVKNAGKNGFRFVNTATK